MQESTLTNLIYDTLLQNDSMSEFHEKLNVNDIEEQEVDEINCKIRLLIDGCWFVIRINKES